MLFRFYNLGRQAALQKLGSLAEAAERLMAPKTVIPKIMPSIPKTDSPLEEGLRKFPEI